MGLTEAQLSIIGNLASILGLTLSIFIAFYAWFINDEVKKITRKVIFNSSTRLILERLNVLNQKALALYERKETDYSILQKEILEITNIITSIQSKLDDGLATQAKKTQKLIKKFRRRLNILSGEKTLGSLILKNKPFHNNELFHIYEACSDLSNNIETFIEERKKVIKNVI